VIVFFIFRYNIPLLSHAIHTKGGKCMDKEKEQSFKEVPYQKRLEMLEAAEISIYDLHEDMQTVDDIPMEELNQKVRVESTESHLNQVPGMVNLERNEQPGEK
jgi:hypothetical protein